LQCDWLEYVHCSAAKSALTISYNNGTGIGHNFLAFVVLKGPEICFCHLVCYYYGGNLVIGLLDFMIYCLQYVLEIYIVTLMYSVY